MRLRRTLAWLIAAVMTAAMPQTGALTELLTSAAQKKPASYTYQVIPLVSPFNRYFYVKTDNPDPLSFRFKDKSSVYGDECLLSLCMKNFDEPLLFADVSYENKQTGRVNGGYIFSSSSIDGGALTLQERTEDIEWGDDEYADTKLTVYMPAVKDSVDYLIDKYATKGSFFENLEAIQSGLYSEALYSGSYIRGEIYQAEEYWSAYISPYADQGLYIGSPYNRRDNKSLLASALFPLFVTSLGFPSTIAEAAFRLDDSVTMEWDDYFHYLINITYKGETRAFGGAGEGAGKAVTEDKIAYRYTFKNSEATTLERLRELQKIYREAEVEDDVPRENALTWKDIYDSLGTGKWVRDCYTYSYWYTTGEGKDLSGEEYDSVGDNIYWGGDVRWASDAWVDGRYINEYKGWVPGAKFEEHPDSPLIVRAVPFFEMSPYYDEFVKKVKDVKYYYNAEKDRWDADPFCFINTNWYSGDLYYENIEELVNEGTLPAYCLEHLILTREEVETMGVDRNTDLFPKSGLIYDGTVAPGTPFNYTIGDVNCDGDVSVDDVLLTQQKIAGWDVFIDKENADIDNDNDISVSDALFIQQIIAGWSIGK